MKYCIKCGTPIEDTAVFCSACGTPVPAVPEQPAAQPASQQPVQPVYQQPVYIAPVQQTPPAPSVKNGVGIAGFVLSLVGLVLACIPVVGLVSLFPLIPGFVLSVVGFILGLVKKRRFGLALAGTILAFCGFFVLIGVYGSLYNVGLYY